MIMASSTITSRQRDVEKMETVIGFIVFGFKITAGSDCSNGIKRHLFLRRKALKNSILKSRDITLPTKVCLTKAMLFLVVIYGSESWTLL